MGRTGENRGRLIAVRVTSAEAREIRLVAKAERVSTSEAIRRAMRQRADDLMRSSGVRS